LAAVAGQLDAARDLWARSAPVATAPDLATTLELDTGPDQAAGTDVATDLATTPELAAVTELVERAAPAGRWTTGSGPDEVGDDGVAAATFWLGARGLLVDPVAFDPTAAVGEGSGDGTPAAPTVRLLPRFPTAWLGGEVEVVGLPVAARDRGARVSFAIRWHGHRPALLWEVTGPGGHQSPAPPLRLTCPGLDPDWSSDTPTGETLLAGTPDRLPPAPAPGEAFS
jgi:hypothetical protein